MIYGIYPEKEERLDKVNLSSNIENFVDECTILHEVGENPKIDEFNLGIEASGFVDFLGIDDIVTNSPNNDFF